MLRVQGFGFQVLGLVVLSSLVCLELSKNMFSDPGNSC